MSARRFVFVLIGAYHQLGGRDKYENGAKKLVEDFSEPADKIFGPGAVNAYSLRTAPDDYRVEKTVIISSKSSKRDQEFLKAARERDCQFENIEVI